MPRKGDNIVRTPTGAYKVKFKVKETILKADGTQATVWRDKSRTFDRLDEAEDFKAGVKLGARKGEVWKDQRTVAVVTFGVLADAFTAAVSNENTKKTRKSYVKSFTTWAGRDTPVTSLTAAYLESYAATLPSDGRKADTRYRKVLEVEQMWEWARGRLDLFPGVPEAQRVTGKYSSAVMPAPPVVRGASPTFGDVDSMIANLRDGWKYGSLTYRIALLLRYTGWRVSQAIGLKWSDVHLDYPDVVEKLPAGPFFILRRGQRGMKSSKGRAVPIHPALLREMAGWGVREGLVFDPGPEQGGSWEDGEAVRLAFRTAWEAAGVDRSKWDVSDAERAAGERAHGSPTHAMRSAVKVGLLRAGISDTLADYYVGHSKGSTHAAYVPEHAPETSPYWTALRDAVATIPDHRDIQKVIHPHPRWGQRG